MAEPVVSFPKYFEQRQIDRAFVVELEMAGVPSSAAGHMMYRIWMDFAHGKSDRRLVDVSNLAQDRAVHLLEKFCGWEGPKGGLVSAAIASGFLQQESLPGGGTVLVCSGFRDFNNQKVITMQSRGGLGKALKVHLREGEAAADEREKLWSRTGGGAFAEIPADQRREAMVFIVQVCRVLGRAIPPDSVLGDGTFHLALEIIRENTEDARKSVLMWLLPNRADSIIPERLDAVLRAWPEFASKAAADGV